MAVDTECDIALAADDQPTATAIAAVRNRLLAEHLGATTHEVETATAETGSLLRTIQRLCGRAHTLEALPTRPPGWLDGLPSEAHVFDPPQPIEPARLLSPRAALGATMSTLLALGAAVAVGIGLGRLWPRRPVIGGHV
jgi:hypothetical protein